MTSARHLRDTITGEVDFATVLTVAFDTIPVMVQRSDARDEGDRQRFVADPDALAALDLKLKQLADPDVRSVVIRHEHPEFEAALKEGRRDIEGSDGPMNPRLHLTTHEVVATQLWDDSPPEVWDTAVRLRDAGYDRHEILAHARAPRQRNRSGERFTRSYLYDHDRHVAALQALPGAWERERTAMTAARHATTTLASRLVERRERARKRNRRPR